MQNYILSSDLSMCTAEDDFLSLPGDVLSNLWCRSPEKRLQREKGRYSLDRKEKVWKVTKQLVWFSVGVGLCGCGCGSMHLGLRSFFALALRPGGIRAPQIRGFCGSVAFWTPLYWWWMAFWGKILCMPRLLAKTPQKAILLQKPPIWGDLFRATMAIISYRGKKPLP